MSTALELKRKDFFPQLFAAEAISLQRLGPSSWRFAAFLWQNLYSREGVSGADEDRYGWSAVEWQNHLSRPGIEFQVLYQEGEPAGCFELEKARQLMKSGPGVIRVHAFGLLPEFTGEGLGSRLLTRMVEKGFAMGGGTISVKSTDALPDSFLTICRAQGFSVLQG